MSATSIRQRTLKSKLVSYAALGTLCHASNIICNNNCELKYNLPKKSLVSLYTKLVSISFCVLDSIVNKKNTDLEAIIR